MLRSLRSAVLALVLLAPGLQAQQRPASSPINDLIARITALVNDFRYADAVRAGESATALVRQMRPDQLLAFNTVMAAAYYPDEASEQRPSAALARLDDVIRLRPDARIPQELRWSGLDSLLEVSRRRVFSAVARPATQYAIAGVEGRGLIDVVSSRPAAFRLRVTSRRDGRMVTHDSATFATTARLGLRAHSGEAVLLDSGSYDISVVAIDAETRDSAFSNFVAEVAASPLALAPRPVFDSTTLLPVMERPRRGSTIFKGLVFAGFTYGIAGYARAEEPLRSAFEVDTRAYAVSGGIFGAALIAAIFDKGRALPQNAENNAKTLAGFQQAVLATDAENRRRITEYRVTVLVNERPAP